MKNVNQPEEQKIGTGKDTDTNADKAKISSDVVAAKDVKTEVGEVGISATN